MKLFFDVGLHKHRCKDTRWDMEEPLFEPLFTPIQMQNLKDCGRGRGVLYQAQTLVWFFCDYALLREF